MVEKGIPAFKLEALISIYVSFPIRIPVSRCDAKYTQPYCVDETDYRVAMVTVWPRNSGT